MDALVGYTGFVGSNLAASHAFGCSFNSSNIEDAFGLRPHLLVFAGLRAEKFIANKYPEKDRGLVLQAASNIRKIQPSALVLVSTVDVYPEPRGVDESSPIDEGLLEPYGANRRLLEQVAPELAERLLIVRLPALYGTNLKKNFVYDMMNRVPSLLTEAKLKELEAASLGIASCYEMAPDGFFKRKPLKEEQLAGLEEQMLKAGFSSLSFTDSRASFQFYGLRFLWAHIEKALDEGIGVLNLATEPVAAGLLFEHIYGSSFENLTDARIPSYDFRSVHAPLFGGSSGYIFNKGYLMDDIKSFVLSGGRQ